MIGPWYWTGAFVLLLAAIVRAGAGWGAVRAGDVERHRRRMTAAALLVAVFLLSYPIKLWLLGREELGAWQAPELWVLRFHEVCVAVMLLAGARAFWLSRSLATARPVGRAEAAGHRLWGRLALGSGILALVSAAAVLRSIWRHAG